MEEVILITDVKPQWLRLGIPTLSAGNYAESETRTPVVAGGKLVMEILKIQYDLPTPDMSSAGASSADELAQHDVHLSSKSETVIQNFIENTVIDKARTKVMSQFAEATETGGAGFVVEEIVVHDLTDGRGNGVLYAAQAIFLGSLTSGITTVSPRVRILYRLVKVSADELLGIIADFLQ